MSEEHTTGGTRIAVEFVVEDIREIKQTLNDMRDDLRLVPLLDVRLSAMETIVKGGVGLVLAGFVAAILKLVL